MKVKSNNFFASTPGIILTGVIIGVFAIILQKAGNPKNMGVCAACFIRDIAGAIGFHKAAVVQYIRPEIPGIILGSMIAAMLFKEFKSQSGSSPLLRFFLGIFAMIGALIFLGCPWRALLRLGGGDLNAITGIVGLAAGIFIGLQFLKKGFTLGKSQKRPAVAGFVLPIVVLGFLVLAIARPAFIAFSTKGPGSLHAPLLVSLVVGLLVGFVVQRSRFCTIGAFRDLFLIRETHLLVGVIAIIVTMSVLNLILGSYSAGYAAQPIAHSNFLWNFLGMVLSGFAFTLAGGCPGRQLVMAGEGNGDSALFILGMLTGAGVAHNFTLAAKPDKIVEGVVQVGGISTAGIIALFIGLVFCTIIGFAMVERD